MKVLKYLTFLTIFILLAEEAHGQGFKPSVAGYVRRAEGYVWEQFVSGQDINWFQLF